MKAAAIQLNSQPDIKKSLSDARQLIDKAVDAGAEFICLPENFAFLGNEKEMYEHAAQIGEAVEDQLPEWAKTFGVTIMAGGYPSPAGEEKYYNRSILITPNGEIAASYHKIHLFDVDLSEGEFYRESDNVEPGRISSVVYKSKNLPAIGFSICYDVRFPELYRQLMEKGTDILTVPSAFTKTTGEAHWNVLLRARAIENSCYVIAAAQTGRHGKKRETFGHSMIIDPWGNILKDAGTEPGYITADIDLQVLKEIRRKLPSIEHRRM